MKKLQELTNRIRELVPSTGKIIYDQAEQYEQYVVFGEEYYPPIQLHHVLQVLTHFAAPELDFALCGHPTIPGMQITVTRSKKKLERKIALWLLDKPLDGQSEETISFLLEILR